MFEIVKWSLTNIMVGNIIDLFTMADDTIEKDMVVVIINVEEVGIINVEEVVITNAEEVVVEDIGGDLNVATRY